MIKHRKHEKENANQKKELKALGKSTQPIPG